jgi:diphthamide biosynthesis enzyme Dph1/Dph2-like protein
MTGRFCGWQVPPREVCAAATVVFVGESATTAAGVAHGLAWARFSTYNPRTRAAIEAESESEAIPATRARLVMRRSHAIEAVKAARVVGVVVVCGCECEARLAVAERLVGVCGERGVRAVVITVVSGIDEVKLANFPDVDAFGVVACPLTMAFLDTRRFHVPVVSAVELWYALTDSTTWPSDYTTDCSTLLLH